MQTQERLTIESIEVRAVSIPMRRPIVSKVGTYLSWTPDLGPLAKV